MVRYFIEVAGMNAATKTGKYGSTILHIATRAGAKKLLQYFIDSDKSIVNIECTDNDGKTALHWACRLGLIDIVTYFIECGHASYVTKDNAGYTPLQLASRNGRFEVVQYIIGKYETDASRMPTTARESDIHASFWLACRFGQFKVVQYLILEGGINVDMKNKSDGMTALLYACQYGTLQHVKFLCEDCKANINVLDKLGESALVKAKTYEHEEVAQYMSERYARISKIEEQLRTAAKCGNLNAVIDCISNNRDLNINAGGSTGKTALHYSIANGHYGIVHYLVRQCGADVNQRTVDGATPLHYACRYGQLKCVQLLCRYGYTVPVGMYLQLVDNQNETALDKAKKYGHDDIVMFLEMFVANINHNVNCNTNDNPVSVQLSSYTLDETKRHVMVS
jgi:ankyrin repeat protein